MYPDPKFRLHEVVNHDPEHGESTVEILDWWPSILDYCCLMNDQAWTTLHFQGDMYRYVKEFPNEVRERILASWHEANGAYNHMFHEPCLRVLIDDEKTVMINMRHVKAIRAIGTDRTRFTFKRGTLTINLPLEWLNVPAEKIKRPIRRDNNGIQKD